MIARAGDGQRWEKIRKKEKKKLSRRWGLRREDEHTIVTEERWRDLHHFCMISFTKERNLPSTWI